MSTKALRTLTGTMLVLGLAAPAFAKSQSGTFKGVQWEAQSNIVAMTSTGGFNGGGDPAFFANQAKYRGVVTLISDYGPGGQFICTGSLLPDRVSILTAGHCVSGGAGTANPLVTTAYFNSMDNPNSRVFQDPASTAITISKYIVNDKYTGDVIDQNDIAILRLSDAAPDYAVSYGLYNSDNLYGQTFNVAGVGGRSDVGGTVGDNSRTGFMRQGDNQYEYRWGDEAFGGFFLERDADGQHIFGTAEIDYSIVADFDSGLAANDAACILAREVGAPSGFGCGLGLGAREVDTAGGDSGGPQFINGLLSSVTSYGLTFGTDIGDCRQGLNSSCGEFFGFVPIYLHYDWIARNAGVPEPGNWVLMIMGFGFAGAGLRRRQHSLALA